MATVFNYNLSSSLVFSLLLIATVIYLAGTFIITIVRNIPLNKVLDKTDLEN